MASAGALMFNDDEEMAETARLRATLNGAGMPAYRNSMRQYFAIIVDDQPIWTISRIVIPGLFLVHLTDVAFLQLSTGLKVRGAVKVAPTTGQGRPIRAARLSSADRPTPSRQDKPFIRPRHAGKGFMPDTTGQRRRIVVYASVISMGLMTAAGALSVAWAAPNTQVIRPPQQATATTPKSAPATAKPTAVKPSAPTGVKRVTTRGATVPSAAPSAAASEEAKPFAIDPSRPLVDQLVAVGVDANDASAAAKAVTTELKGASLSVGNTGRAALVSDGTNGTRHRLQSLQIFGATGIVADVERGADGKFTGRTATAVASAQPPAVVRPASLSTDPSSADAGQDDPRMWSAREGQSLRTAKSLRDIAQSTVGLRRISANGDTNVALANAGIETSTARAAAQALAAVAPASLDRRSANIEVVNGRTGDGQVRLLTATIYDRNSRGQVWWFAPRNQPEGFFDERGNRVGDSGMTLPIEGSHISSPFGTRRWGRWAAFHNGLDVAGQYGTPIIAAADGVVDYSGWYYNYGKTVRIVHSDSLATSYSHMSNFAVSPGTRVRKGQVIGYVGSTGRSTGPHLHFCVLVDGQFVNPAPYVAGGGGGPLTGQDLVSFRDWQRTTAGMARGGATRRASSESDGYNRL